MLAASYWSLLNPALELAEQQGWGRHNILVYLQRRISLLNYVSFYKFGDEKNMTFKNETTFID